MEQLILLEVFTLTVGLIWGGIIYKLILLRSIKKGRLPKYLENKKDEILDLLNEEIEGGDCLQPPGSEPG